MEEITICDSATKTPKQRTTVPPNTLEPHLAIQMLAYFQEDFCVGQNGACDSASFPDHQHFQLLKNSFPVFEAQEEIVPTQTMSSMAISKVNYPGNPIKICFPYTSIHDPKFIDEFKMMAI